MKSRYCSNDLTEFACFYKKPELVMVTMWKGETTNKTVADISKLDVRPPESSRINNDFIDSETKDRVDNTAFVNDITESWRERSVELINLRLDVNPDAVGVVQGDGSLFAVTSGTESMLRDVIDVVDQHGVGMFDIESHGEPLAGFSFYDHTFLSDYSVSNDSEACDHIINEVNNKLRDNLNLPVQNWDIKTYHGEFLITHFAPLDIE